MSEWRKCVWGDIATLEYGKSLSGYRDGIGHVPVYGTNGQIGWTDEALYESESIIVGRKGAYRGVHYSDIPFFVIDTAFYLKPIVDSDITFDMKWAYYQLLTVDINSMDSGSAIPSTSRDDFYNVPVHVPPLDEQRAIAYILGSLDDKIEANRRQNATLDASARALFKSWFVDFDPVHAKAAGEVPHGMDSETAALFPTGFEESELGRIPAGWRVDKLKNLIEVNRDNIKKDYPFDEIEYITISSVTVGSLEGTVTHTLDDAPSRAKRIVRHGDTIWSTVRPSRKSYLFIHSPPENMIASTGFIVLSPESIPSTYLYYWVTTDRFIEYLAFNASGSAYPAVNQSRFKASKTLVPPSELLQRFHELTIPMRDKIHANTQENRTLAALRDTLLPRLVSGELQVGEAQDMMENV